MPYNRNGDWIDDGPVITDTTASAEQETDEDERLPPPPPKLLLPVMPDRDPRLISCEQEVGKGSEDIAYLLHSEGLSEHPSVFGYHSPPLATRQGRTVHVEEDGSVDGEIIWGKLRLDQARDARWLEDGLHVVRRSVKEDDASLDMRCGFHTHVNIGGYSEFDTDGEMTFDVPAYGMADVASLYHLWNHLEDTIYRLSAANWRAHRSLVAPHDYAPPTRKGLESRVEVGQFFFGGNRGGLNLENYLSSRRNCSCTGTLYEDWASCRCNLGKSTAEFRVFNATANIRKVHAFTALSLAMVEAARRMRFEPTLNPVFEWSRTEALPTRGRQVEATKQALEVIFTSLPLTNEEREDLAYCAQHSSLASIYEAYAH